MKRYRIDHDRKGAVGYTRVSTVDQVKGYSLINQERAIKNKCLEDGLDLVGIYTDEGRSARTKDRPGFLRAVDAAIKNKDKVSSFIVYRWDRFSRDVKDHHLIKERLKKHGIVLISVKEGRVDSSPTSKLAHDIAAAFNEYESRLIGDRAKNGMTNARRSGNMTNRPPQGYLRRTEGGNKRTIHRDPERAALIKQAFEMFAEGTYSQKDITDHLNRIGYKTPSGRHINQSQLGKMLRNRTYTGMIFVNDEEGWVFGNFNAIVDEETFEKCQTILGERKRVESHY